MNRLITLWSLASKLGKVFVGAILLVLLNQSALADTLESHIAKTCKRGCVDTNTLLNATVNQAEELKIDFKILLAVITVESGFILMAKNKGNAGLMQILISTHKHKFKTNVFDPDENIRVGAGILKDCMSRHRSLPASLRCYNGGGDKKYPAKVLKALSTIRNIKF